MLHHVMSRLLDGARAVHATVGEDGPPQPGLNPGSNNSG